MSNSKNARFIEQLSSDVRFILLQSEKLRGMHNDLLLKKPTPAEWSIAQCLQHMNVYSDYYLIEIEKAISTHQSKPTKNFTSGLLGKYFTNMMQLNSDGFVKKKLKSPKNAVPSALPDATKELTAFIQHQHTLLNLLNIGKSSDLNKIKIPISIARFIKLKLGDVMAFFIAHEKRHMAQIDRIRGTF